MILFRKRFLSAEFHPFSRACGFVNASELTNGKPRAVTTEFRMNLRREMERVFMPLSLLLVSDGCNRFFILQKQWQNQPEQRQVPAHDVCPDCCGLAKISISTCVF